MIIKPKFGEWVKCNGGKDAEEMCGHWSSGTCDAAEFDDNWENNPCCNAEWPQKQYNKEAVERAANSTKASSVPDNCRRCPIEQACIRECGSIEHGELECQVFYASHS